MECSALASGATQRVSGIEVLCGCLAFRAGYRAIRRCRAPGGMYPGAQQTLPEYAGYQRDAYCFDYSASRCTRTVQRTGGCAHDRYGGQCLDAGARITVLYRCWSPAEVTAAQKNRIAGTVRRRLCITVQNESSRYSRCRIRHVHDGAVHLRATWSLERVLYPKNANASRTPAACT